MKTLLSIVVFGLLFCGVAHAQIDGEKAVRTILGEEENSFEGQKWVASTIRNRGGLHGAYGYRAIVKRGEHYYRQSKKGLRKLSDISVANARQAWQLSRTHDYSNGCTNWFSDQDLQQANVQRIIRKGNLQFAKRFGSKRYGNNFYREA